ncbi:hypothetical protein D3C87_1748780 [compost metagenome]
MGITVSARKVVRRRLSLSDLVAGELGQEMDASHIGRIPQNRIGTDGRRFNITRVGQRRGFFNCRGRSKSFLAGRRSYYQ